MNLPTTQKLIATARNQSARQDDLQQAAQQFFAAVEKVSQREAEAQIALLAEHYELPDPERGAFLAIICGALVERGCDPLPMARSLRLRLETLLADCARLADACRQEMPERAKPRISRAERDEFGDEEEEPSPVDDDEFRQALDRVARKLPRELAAWNALNTFWRPAIAVFSVSPEARWAAQALRAPAQRIAEYHEGGHWIQLILSVLDNEPLLVIEPATRTGFLARSFGIVDNFQLNTLLMDAFPTSGPSGMRRVPLNIAEIARGNGPQESDDVVTGVWNLYTWQALRPILQLPEKSDNEASQHWIWNEGVPGDIPLFEDRRVILLGPPSYERSWRAMRMFERLPARLHIERHLTPAEATAWLERIAKGK